MPVRIIALLLCAIGAAAQDAGPTLSDGATLAIRLDRGISSARAHAGDPVAATLLAPILSRGVVLVPRNARITGHALAVEGRKKGGDSRLLIRFEEVSWGGEAFPINAYIVRQLGARGTVRRGNSDTTCPEATNYFQVRRRGVDPASLPQAPKFDPPPCYDRVTHATPEVTERFVFTSPPLKNMRLQKAAAPQGATELVSHKKDVELARGTMLEIRQTPQ